MQKKDFFIGGLSIGGTHALKYAELAVQNNYPIKAKAVFGIDPPLDYVTTRVFGQVVCGKKLTDKIKGKEFGDEKIKHPENIYEPPKR